MMKKLGPYGKKREVPYSFSKAEPKKESLFEKKARELQEQDIV